MSSIVKGLAMLTSFSAFGPFSAVEAGVSATCNSN
jgi:hypothetical protein